MCWRGHSGKRAERHQIAVCRPHIDVLQAIGILPEVRLYLQDNTVLVQLFVHRGDLALAEGIIERIGDRRGAHPKT